MDSGEKIRRATGVTVLINNFRDSLLSLLPFLEKGGINWNELDKYDVFDGVCEYLFELIVLNKIKNFLENKHGFIPQLPKYGLFYKDYAKSSYFEVLLDKAEQQGRIYAFVLLKSKFSPFDTVLCNLIDERGNVIQREIELKFDEVTFRFRFKSDNQDISLS